MHKNGRRTADVVAVVAAVGNVGNMIVSIHLCGSDYFVHMPEGRKEGLSKLDSHPSEMHSCDVLQHVHKQNCSPTPLNSYKHELVSHISACGAVAHVCLLCKIHSMHKLN